MFYKIEFRVFRNLGIILDFFIGIVRIYIFIDWGGLLLRNEYESILFNILV